EINDHAITFFDLVPFQHIREAANFAMQMLIGERAFIARFAFPDNCRLVPARSGQMPIQTVLRDVEFPADEPLREWSLPLENFFPRSAPAQLALFARPQFCRLPDRFLVHPPILTKTFDSRVFGEVP